MDNIRKEKKGEDRLSRELFPFTSRYFKTGEWYLHYIDEGSGPVVLMMHSCPWWSFEFRHLIRELRTDHRVIAIDQMGFGLSDKPQNYNYHLEIHADHVESLVSSLGLTDITLVMHGRGTTIGMAYAVRDPDNIKAIVTFNTQSFSDFHLPLCLQFCRIRTIGAYLIVHSSIFKRDLWNLPSPVREAYKLPFPNEKSRVAFFRFVEELPCVPEDPSAQTMIEIEAALWLLRQKPVCILWAEKDWMYRLNCLTAWKNYFPNADCAILKNAGRFVTEDVPDEINQLIRAFFAKNNL